MKELLEKHQLRQQLINHIIYKRPRKIRKFSEEWSKELEEFGFNQVPFLLLIAPDLRQEEKLLLVLIRSYGEIFSGLTKTLALNLGLTVSGVQRILQSLERKGWIKREMIWIEAEGVKRKVRVIDTRPAVGKLEEFRKSDLLYTFLTKRKHWSVKNKSPYIDM